MPAAEPDNVACVLVADQPTQNHDQGHVLALQSGFESRRARIAFTGRNPLDGSLGKCSAQPIELKVADIAANNKDGGLFSHGSMGAHRRRTMRR